MKLMRVGDNYLALGGNFTKSGLWVPNRGIIPPTGDWPSAANTGIPPGTVLTNHVGNLYTTAPGQTFSELNVTGGQGQVLHDDTTFYRCRINATGNRWGIDGHYNIPHSGLKVIECEIFGCWGSAILTGEYSEILRNNLHTTTEGVMLGGGNSIIKDNFMHSQWSDDADPHFDNVQGGGGWTNVLIEHNWMEGQDTSNILAQCEFGPYSDLRIIGNYLDLTRVAASFAYLRGWDPGDIEYAEFKNNVLVGTAWSQMLDLTNGPTEFVFSGNVDINGNPVTDYWLPFP